MSEAIEETNDDEFIYDDKEASPSDSLLTFMSQAPGFTIDKFKGK